MIFGFDERKRKLYVVALLASSTCEKPLGKEPAVTCNSPDYFLGKEHESLEKRRLIFSPRHVV